MNKKTVSIIVLVAIVVGALSFFGGQAYANKKKQSNRIAGTNFQGQFGMTGRMNQRGSMMGQGSNMIAGVVVSIDETSMTVKGRDGSSKVIFFTQATPVMKMVAGTADDVAVGKEITITGTTNPDGSVTAQSIQARQTSPQIQN